MPYVFVIKFCLGISYWLISIPNTPVYTYTHTHTKKEVLASIICQTLLQFVEAGLGSSSPGSAIMAEVLLPKYSDLITDRVKLC